MWRLSSCNAAGSIKERRKRGLPRHFIASASHRAEVYVPHSRDYISWPLQRSYFPCPEGDVPSFRYPTIGPPDCKTAFDRPCQECYLLFANHFLCAEDTIPGRTAPRPPLQTVSSLTTYYHFKRLFFSFMCYASLNLILYCFPPTCHPLVFIV